MKENNERNTPAQQRQQAAAVLAGEGRRRTARATRMKLRCIREFATHGGGDYLCWFSIEGRIDYYGETSGGRAHGWGLAEYQDGSWCIRCLSPYLCSCVYRRPQMLHLHCL